MFNTMPAYSAAQFQQLPRTAMPMFSTPVSSHLAGLPLQQGARIVWTAPPRNFQPNLAPLVTAASVSQAMKTNSTTTATTANKSGPQASTASSSANKAAAFQLKHQQDNAALLSLATTALSTAPMASSPALSHQSSRAVAPQAIMVSSPTTTIPPPSGSTSTAALFATADGQQFLTRPYLHRMPMGTQFVTTTANASTRPNMAGILPRPQTGQLVFARLPPNQTSQPRYLITQPGFPQQRFQVLPQLAATTQQHLQPGLTTLAYAAFKNPPANDATKTVKAKKVKTS